MILMILVGGIVALAFLTKHPVLFAISCPLCIVYGISIANAATVGSATWIAGVAIAAVIGSMCLYSPVLAVFEKERGKRK